MTLSSDLNDQAARETGCPSSRELQDFLGDRLSPLEAAHCGQHLDQCLDCQKLIESWLEQEQVKSALTVSDGQTIPFPSSHLITDDSLGISDRFSIRGYQGSGGSGTVYRAWDRILKREVALKLPHFYLQANPQSRARFAIEARATAKLSHPNIVPVFDAILKERTCLLVAEFIDGKSLANWLAARPSGSSLDVRFAAQLMVGLADAMSVAHGKKILHRDLKPLNILLDTTQPDGALPFTARITDFGSARLEDDIGAQTVTGTIIGSFCYMSPEQASGKKDLLGPQTDLYSLGVILYELLTGRVPLDSENKVELLRLIADVDPPPPRRLRKDLPADLEAICLKCLEKQPSRRYATAADLRDDLRRFLVGEVVHARHPSLSERLVRTVSRYPALSTSIVTILLAVVVVIFALTRSNSRLNQFNQELKVIIEERDNALSVRNASLLRERKLLEEAKASSLAAERRLYVSRIQQAAVALKQHDFVQADFLLNQCRENEQTYPCEFDWKLLRNRVHIAHEVLYQSPAAIYAFAWSPDETILAITGKDSVVRLLKYPEITLVREWPTHQIEANAVLFMNNGKDLWTTGDDGTLCVWDVTTGRELSRQHAHDAPLYDLVPALKHDRVFSLGRNNYIGVWEAHSRKLLGPVETNGEPIRNIAVSQDQSELYSAGNHDSFSVWDVTTLTRRPSREALYQVINDFNTGIGHQHMAIADRTRDLEIRNSLTNQLVARYRTSEPIAKMVYLPKEETLIAIDQSSIVHAWRQPWNPKPPSEMFPVSSYELRELAIGRLTPERIFTIQVSPDQNSVVFACADGTLRKLSTSQLIHPGVEEVPLTTLRNMMLSRDGKAIYTRLHSTLQKRAFPSLKILWEVRVDPNSHECLFQRTDESIVVHRIGPQKASRLDILSPVTGQTIQTIAIRHTQDLIYRGSPVVDSLDVVVNDGKLDDLIYVNAQQKRDRRFAENKLNTTCWDMHPRRPEIASGISKELRIYNIKTEKLIPDVKAVEQDIQNLKYSPHGTYLAGFLRERRLIIWETSHLDHRRDLPATNGQLASWCFSPDEQFLLMMDDQNTLSVLNVKHGDLRLEFPAESHHKALGLFVTSDNSIVSYEEDLLRIRH